MDQLSNLSSVQINLFQNKSVCWNRIISICYELIGFNLKWTGHGLDYTWAELINLVVNRAVRNWFKYLLQNRTVGLRIMLWTALFQVKIILLIRPLSLISEFKPSDWAATRSDWTDLAKLHNQLDRKRFYLMNQSYPSTLLDHWQEQLVAIWTQMILFFKLSSQLDFLSSTHHQTELRWWRKIIQGVFWIFSYFFSDFYLNLSYWFSLNIFSAFLWLWTTKQVGKGLK